MMPKEETTEELLESRVNVYGDRVANMERVAQMWSGFLGTEIHPWQVPVMFALYKMYRLGVTPDYSDSVDDVDGYMQMFREVIGDNMIQARTVEEYLAKKGTRPTQGYTVEIDGQTFTREQWEAVLKWRLGTPDPRHPYEVAEQDAIVEEYMEALGDSQ